MILPTEVRSDKERADEQIDNSGSVEMNRCCSNDSCKTYRLFGLWWIERERERERESRGSRKWYNGQSVCILEVNEVFRREALTSKMKNRCQSGRAFGCRISVIEQERKKKVD